MRVKDPGVNKRYRYCGRACQECTVDFRVRGQVGIKVPEVQLRMIIKRDRQYFK